MKIFVNPNCVKVRGSHLLEVSCAYCKYYIAKYQKVGESNFVKMYNERIIEGTIDFSLYQGAIFCPNCGAQIATRYMTKMDKKEAYRFTPSAFNKKKVSS
jgi:ribosomal protein S27E